jgi:hypothetical protein
MFREKVPFDWADFEARSSAVEEAGLRRAGGLAASYFIELIRLIGDVSPDYDPAWIDATQREI